MELRTDYSHVAFANNGKLKLLIIVGTRPEIIRLAAVINKCRKYFDTVLAHHSKKKQYLCTRFRKRYVSRSRAVVARQAHNLKVGGSIPPSATKLSHLTSVRWLFL